MPEIEKLAVALLVSCDYEAPKRMATAERWKQGFAVLNVHIVFSAPRKFAFRFSTFGPAKVREVFADELLFPVSREGSPDYILVRYHDHFRAFAKYHDQEALAGLRRILS